MSSLRRLGDVEWIPLSGDLEGISVGIKHVGMGAVHRWEHMFSAFRFREWPRIMRAQRRLIEDEGLTEKQKADAPKFFPQYFPENIDQVVAATEEGEKEDAEIAQKILSECVVGVQGREGDPFSLLDQFGLMGVMVAVAIEKQYLKPTDPLVEGGRLLPSDRSADVGRSE